MIKKYLRKIHNQNLSLAMDKFYSKILKDEQYQDLNQKWGHLPLQFNLETPFERDFKNNFLQSFEGSILEIGAGLTPLTIKNNYTGIDLSAKASNNSSKVIQSDFINYPISNFDLVFSQDCLMPKMASNFKIPKSGLIICNGVRGIEKWIKKIKIDEVIEVEDFNNQLENMKKLLEIHECDDWIKVTRLNEFNSILKLNLKRYILLRYG